jgi:GT2 family glycosyltransferase
MSLACIDALYRQDAWNSDDMSVFVVDDGSVDGTSAAINQRFPSVRVIQTAGNLFWSGAMRRGMEEALKANYDLFLWLNDDVVLYEGALRLLLCTVKQLRRDGFHNSIVVGSLRDPTTRELSYGGWKSDRGNNPLRCRKLEPSDSPLQCDSINGNCVLIPRDVITVVGNLDPTFTHGMADMDYGFRARMMGCTIWVAPGYVGTCELNSGKGLWTDHSLPIRERWKRLLEPKGLPPREWLVFTRRHSGWLWPLYWVNPYVKFWLKGFLGVWR